MTKENSKKLETFTEQGIQNISDFSDILKRIHIRLISEGYIIKDGLITKPIENDNLQKNKEDSMINL